MGTEKLFRLVTRPLRPNKVKLNKTNAPAAPPNHNKASSETVGHQLLVKSLKCAKHTNGYKAGYARV